MGEGDGPVNALDSALRKALVRFYPAINDVSLTDYHVRTDPKEATAAKTRWTIESSDGRDTWGTVAFRKHHRGPPGKPWWTAWNTTLYRRDEQRAVNW